MNIQRYTPLRRTGWGGKTRNKFFAKPVHLDNGQSFDSTTEYRRYTALETYQRIGVISGLTLHPKIVLVAKRGKAPEIAFRPDYSYTEKGRTVYEDSKARPMTARDSLIFKLWAHYGPSLLRITGAKGETKREIMPGVDV